MNIVNPEKTYKTSDYVTYSCQYHVIFCTKYRRSVLDNGAGERAKELFYEIADKYGFTILDAEIMPEYVHLLIDCNPEFGIMECVKKLKRDTARPLRDEFPELKRKLPTLWTRNAFISTAGAVSLEDIDSFINDQKGK